MKTRTAKLNSLVFESVLVTLIVLAFQKGSQDPLHPVKLFILGILAVWILSTFIASKKAFLILRNRYPLNLYASILFIFIFFLLISTFKTSVISIGILGDTGRNMGFLNYLFLSIVALFYALRFDITNAKSFYIIFFVLATVLSIYGFFQHYHMDFLRWQTKGNPVILTVGNPDFASSLLAIVGTVTIAGLFIETFGKYRFFLVIPAVSTGFTIYFTQAIQGLVIYAISVTFLTTLYIYQKNQTVGRILFLFDFCGLLFSFFGTLKIGPFSSYFYKSSIADRGYDWRAAISMLKKHPIFGVGLDRYGYYFPELKDKIYPIRFGYETTVNNAHNVFLQFFATAGIFVGITYLTLTIFVAWRAFLALKNSSGSEQIITAGFVAAWLGYLLQSIIAPDTLPVSIWGWVLAGVIVALSSKKVDLITTRDLNFIEVTQEQARRDYRTRVGITFTLGMCIFLIFSSYIYKNEVNTYNFVNTVPEADQLTREKYREISAQLFRQPLLNPNYKAAIALAMGKNSYAPEVVLYMKETIMADRRNNLPYKYLASYYEYFKQPKDAIPYRIEISKLDPWNADSLLLLELDYLAVGDFQSASRTSSSIVNIDSGTKDAQEARAALLKK